MELATQQSILREEVKRLMHLPYTNEKLMDIKTHERYLNYLVKEFFSKDEEILRLTKLEWLALQCPFDPVKKESIEKQTPEAQQNLEIAESYLGFAKEVLLIRI